MKSKGITFFPMDTDFDRSMKKFRRLHGVKGIGLWLLIIMAIQKEDGYYIELDLEDDESLEDLAFTVDEDDEDFVKKIVEYLIEKDVFSKEMYRKHRILTSKRLQKNFLYATKRRKQVDIPAKYKIVDINGESVDTNPKSVDSFDESVSNNDESVDNKKETIPYKKIIDYLNKVSGLNAKHTTADTQKKIKARFSEGFRYSDFLLAIDNAVKFRTKNGVLDNQYLHPKTLFNGQFEGRVMGTAYGWEDETKDKKDPSLEGRY